MTKRKALIWDYNSSKATELVRKLRFQGLDTIRNRVHIDDVREEYYSACVFMLPQTKISNALSDYEKLKRRMPTMKIEEAGIENIDYIADFLRQNNCKQWNLKKEVNRIVKEISDFLTNEAPLIDLSEPYISVVSAGIAKKALSDRASRFIFFDRGNVDIDFSALADFFEECTKYFGVRPVYIDLRDKIPDKFKIKEVPIFNSNQQMHQYFEEYEKIHEVALHNVFGDVIDGNGIVEAFDEYDGRNYLVINRHSSFWHPAYAVNKIIHPCARFFTEELDDVAKILELSEKLINPSKLFKKI